MHIWDVTLCSPERSTDVSHKHTASIFRVEEYITYKSVQHAGSLLGLFFNPDGKGNMFF
jgi:hypothetical protein